MQEARTFENHMDEHRNGDIATALRAVPDAAICRVSVVIPTLNEAENLPHVFSRLPTDLHEVILVDGGSKDNTVDVARALYPSIRVVPQGGRGKGNALACGFAACTGDVIVMLDADGSADPGEIPLFVEALLAGADFAKGSRRMAGGGSADITRFRGAGNAALTGIVNVLFGTSYSDLCYGYNAFWTRCLPHLDVDCDGFEVETLINIRLARTDLDVREVPSFEHLRLHGSSNLRPVRDGLRCARTIVKERFRSTARSVRVAYDHSSVVGHDDLALEALEPGTAG
jgi:glycosyltransferase involved in cell wall biosynthesis